MAKDAGKNESTSSFLTLKQANLKAVLNEIYRMKSATILSLAQNLKMSIPTVTTCLKQHLDTGYVKLSEKFVYTGGRKSKLFEFNALGRISIGVKLLKESAEIVATDLYGTVLEESCFDRVFEDEPSYYEAFGIWVNSFTAMLPYGKDKILGVAIALQGLVGEDGESVYYSKILRSSEISKKKFQEHIEYEVMLMHDLEAAAFFECWQRDDISNAIYFILNKNFGAMIILDKSVSGGKSHKAIGTIEHMCLDPSGEECYCGRRGCIETFCSADSLKGRIGDLGLSEFFSLVHRKDPQYAPIWHDFLKHLALAANNVRMVMDKDLLIGGYLVQFMDDEDFMILENYVNEDFPFKTRKAVIKKSFHADETIKLGSSLMLISKTFGFF